jgi:hypothetical protein
VVVRRFTHADRDQIRICHRDFVFEIRPRD